jgi:tetratricopeptide (TPR) repeat protein
MYLPSMFLILSGTAWLYRIAIRKTRTARLIIVGSLLLLSLFTWQRNSVWKNEITFWTDVTQKSPGSLRAHSNLGLAYINAKDFDTAKYYLAKAIAIGHNDKSSNFGFAARKSYLAVAHNILGVAYRETGNFPAAIKHAEQALKLHPGNPNSPVILGITYSKLGQDLKAYEYFSKASKEGVVSVDLYNNWEVSSFKLGMVDKSIQLLIKAIKLLPDHAESHYNLGIAYSNKGMLKEAQEEMGLAMQLRNKNKK